MRVSVQVLKDRMNRRKKWGAGADNMSNLGKKNLVPIDPDMPDGILTDPALVGKERPSLKAGERPLSASNKRF